MGRERYLSDDKWEGYGDGKFKLTAFKGTAVIRVKHSGEGDTRYERDDKRGQ